MSLEDPVEAICKRGAKNFRGSKNDDHVVAENWLSRVCRVIEELECFLAKSIRCDISLLEDEAYQWWTILTSMISRDQVNWEFFLKKFREKFINRLFIKQMKNEFFELKQGENKNVRV